MAYDETLSARFRAALGDRAGLSEKKMMGSLCFFLAGNMIGGASRSKDGVGRFLFRVGKENQAAALTRDGAYVMEMGGRRMSGFVSFNEENCNDESFKDCLDLALGFVGTLPPK